MRERGRKRERERERARAWAGEEQREGDTESKAGSRLWAVSTKPDAGLKPTNCEIMTWTEVGCSADWATQASLYLFFNIKYNLLSNWFPYNTQRSSQQVPSSMPITHFPLSPTAHPPSVSQYLRVSYGRRQTIRGLNLKQGPTAEYLEEKMQGKPQPLLHKHLPSTGLLTHSKRQQHGGPGPLGCPQQPPRGVLFSPKFSPPNLVNAKPQWSLEGLPSQPFAEWMSPERILLSPHRSAIPPVSTLHWNICPSVEMHDT